MKSIILIISSFLGLANLANGQDCLSLKDFYSSIDTTSRPVFTVAEKYPEISDGGGMLRILERQRHLFDSLQCWPSRVWVGFVVETDSTLTNIQVCTQMTLCDDKTARTESKKFSDRMTALLKSSKSAPGELWGKKVAVVCSLPIHLDPNR